MNNNNMEPVNPTKQHSKKCRKLSGGSCDCDSFHTWRELYGHRHTLFITLCRMVQQLEDDRNDRSSDTSSSSGLKREGMVWRSEFHSDGTSFPGWFIMGIGRKVGEQITYHLPNGRWDDTSFAETLDRAPEYDGHTPDDVLKRLEKL